MATAPLALTPTLPPPRYRRPLHRHAECCLNKQQHLTREDAQAVLDGLQAWLGCWSPLMQVYECTACWGYHLGRYAGVGDT